MHRHKPDCGEKLATTIDVLFVIDLKCLWIFGWITVPNIVDCTRSFPPVCIPLQIKHSVPFGPIALWPILFTGHVRLNEFAGGSIIVLNKHDVYIILFIDKNQLVTVVELISIFQQLLPASCNLDKWAKQLVYFWLIKYAKISFQAKISIHWHLFCRVIWLFLGFTVLPWFTAAPAGSYSTCRHNLWQINGLNFEAKLSRKVTLFTTENSIARLVRLCRLGQ